MLIMINRTDHSGRHIGQIAAMLNHQFTQDQDFHIACVRDTADGGLVDRWATDADRAYAAERRSGSTLLALAALRSLLFSVTRQSGWIVHRTAQGKPSVTAPDGSDGPAVSLSHSSGLIAVAAIRAGCVGIDVEWHRSRDFAALEDQAFGPAERREVAAGGAEAFYRIWTLREAMAKATGDGLAMVLNRLDLANGVLDDHVRIIDRAGKGWRLAHVRAAPGYSLGIASPCGDSLGPAARIQWVALS